mmetsp:Transcript_46625/g.54040  ORF Transcript_46625/g.54040 Transcript_46625/m.54040 type:complete len:97 (-) Transcript_46625:52-342(-)
MLCVASHKLGKDKESHRNALAHRHKFHDPLLIRHGHGDHVNNKEYQFQRDRIRNCVAVSLCLTFIRKLFGIHNPNVHKPLFTVPNHITVKSNDSNE